MKKIKLITDGACKGNPGRGGWGVLLRYGKHSKEIWGYEPHTTNNRMELTAAVRGLEALNEKCDVEIVTDSEYVKNGITKWINGWKRNGWITSTKQPVLNKDLWEALDRQVARHKVVWTWTKGHAGHADNDHVDGLASKAAKDQSAGSRSVVADGS